MSHLLPCPFCGSTRVEIIGTIYGEFEVVCHGCSVGTGHSPSKDVIISCWNTRQHGQTIPAEPPWQVLMALAGEPVILAASVEQELRRRYAAMREVLNAPAFATQEGKT